MPRDFKRIRAWELSDDLCVEIYRVTWGFPREERYGLTSQIRRSAVSVPANIAEGAGRQHKKEYLHFLYIAKGSLSETRYHLHLSRRFGYLSPEEYGRLDALQNEAAATLQGLIASVQRETGMVTRLIALASSSIALYALNRFAGAGL